MIRILEEIVLKNRIEAQVVNVKPYDICMLHAILSKMSRLRGPPSCPCITTKFILEIDVKKERKLNYPHALGI